MRRRLNDVIRLFVSASNRCYFQSGVLRCLTDCEKVDLNSNAWTDKDQIGGVESQIVGEVSVIPDRQHSITVDRDIDNGQLMSPAPMDRPAWQPARSEIEIQGRQHCPDTSRQLSANEGRYNHKQLHQRNT